MNKTMILKYRLNSSLGIISLFSVISISITVFCFILQLIVQPFLDMDTINFYILFIMPQFLLPVLTAATACVIPFVGSFKFKDCVKSEKIPPVYFFLCIGIFPGLSTICSIVSYSISEALRMIGIPILDVNSSIPVPQTPFQIFLMFLVMAVLPAICEELIYRGFLLRGVSEFGKAGAVVVSSFAFGLMHATIQQIPFAFAIGLFLGYITLRFKSLLLPIILHFINNSIACLFLLLQNYFDPETVNIMSVCIDLFFIVLSLLCGIIFIILIVSEKKKTENKESLLKYDDTLSVDIKVEPEKVNYLKSVTHSWGFWLFTCIYLISTVSNVVLTAVSAGL